MKKHIIPVILILCMALGLLSACSNPQVKEPIPNQNPGAITPGTTDPITPAQPDIPAKPMLLSSDNAVAMEIRVAVNGNIGINTFNGYLLDDEFFFTQSDIEKALPIADINVADYINTNNETYYSLRDVARELNISYKHDDVMNICGAYLLPEYRGKGIFDSLFFYVENTLAQEGVKLLGVDFESYNLTANGFWMKYFTAYTYSVARRIDEQFIKRSINRT